MMLSLLNWKETKMNDGLKITGIAATYVMCVSEGSDDVKAVYIEPEIIVSPIELAINQLT